jgi:enoyl-CoA hydratase/carnithine racemase
MSETTSWVSLERDDGVAVIQFRRPPVNQFDDAFLTQVLDSVEDLGEETRALVVTSAVERMFAAGGDIPWMATAPMDKQLPFLELCQRCYAAFEQIACPTIAAIEGPCLGGGLELALACDIRVAGRGAVLGLPESTIGLIAGGGSTQRLVRAVGQSIARDLLITGRRVSGEEAGAMGIVSRIVDDGEAIDAALALARRLADGPTESIQASKRLAIAASDLQIEDGLAREREEWTRVRRSAATQEALEAFAEKRRPDFRSLRAQRG